MPGEPQSDTDKLAAAVQSLQAVVAQMCMLVHTLRGQTKEQARGMTANQPTGQKGGGI